MSLARFLIAATVPRDAWHTTGSLEVDGAGRTPPRLAVRACVASYWTERRSPESVALLLATGAAPGDIPLPSGYEEVDQLLRSWSDR